MDMRFVYFFMFVLGLLLIIYFLYIIISNKKDQTFLNSLIFREKNNYIFIANFKESKISIFDKNKKSSKTLSFDDLKEKLFNTDLNKFIVWLNGLRNDKNISIPCIISLKNIDDNNEIINIKLTYNDYTNECLFLDGTLLDNNTLESLNKINKVNLLSLTDLKNYVESISETSRKEYDIFCINCGEYDLILKHYGEYIANQYVLKLASKIQYCLKKIDAELYHYEKDIFIIYNSNVNNYIKRKIFANYLYKNIKGSILVDIYQFEISPTIGLSSSKLYSTDPLALSKEAYQASLYTKNSPYRIFDSSLVEGLRKVNVNIIDYHKEKENLGNYISFYKVFSLVSGKDLGYLTEYTLTGKNILSLEKMLEASKEYDDTRNFHLKLLTCSIDNFYSTHSNSDTLFIFGNLEMLRFLVHIYGIGNKLKDKKIIFIFNSYKELLDYPKRAEDLLKQSEPYNISFGLVASNLMTTTLNKLMKSFSWLVISTQFAKDISTSNTKKEQLENILYFVSRYNYKLLAYKVSNYKDAQILKDLGVSFMEGSLFDERENDDYVSVRQISKLMDYEEGD